MFEIDFPFDKDLKITKIRVGYEFCPTNNFRDLTAKSGCDF